MKKISLIFILLIIGTAKMSEIHASTDTSEYKKPVYIVKISYAGTGAEFRLNDIPIYLENFSGQVDVEIPVSDKMVQGINELTIIAFPFVDEDAETDSYMEDWEHNDARVEATLYVREHDDLTIPQQLLTHIKLYPARPPEVAAIESVVIAGQELPIIDILSQPRQFPGPIIYKQSVISRKTHPIATPFPRWEWQDGITIEESEENYKTLLEAYRKQYNIYEKKDLIALKQSNRKLAETEMLVKYHLDIDRAYDMLNLEESWNSEEQELFEFIEGDLSESFGLKLEVVANGKLARIVDNENTQPIVYVVKTARMTIKYKFLFYKNKQGDWVYIM